MSLLYGFTTLERLVPPSNNTKSITRISRHCFNLAKYLFNSLKKLKYANGQSVVKLYHDTDFQTIEEQGGIVNFNLLHDDGSFIGFAEVIFGCYCWHGTVHSFCFPNSRRQQLPQSTTLSYVLDASVIQVPVKDICNCRTKH